MGLMDVCCHNNEQEVRRKTPKSAYVGCYVSNNNEKWLKVLLTH